MAKLIALTKGQFAQVDDIDFEALNQRQWHARWDGRGRKYYAACNDRQADGSFKMLKMQNAIMPPPKGYIVDHRNRDSLDNRRCNLRLATQQQNRMNATLRRRSTSGHTGVYWLKHLKKWTARINFGTARRHLGVFAKKDDAIAARRAAEAQYFGEFAPSVRLRRCVRRYATRTIRANRINNTSDYSNVNWIKGYEKWEVSFHRKGKRTHLGYFDDKMEAVRARDEFLRKEGREP